MNDEFREEVLRAHGAGDAEVVELLAYGAQALDPPAEAPAFPLPDEPFAATWDGYAAEAEARGAWTVLRERLPQLRFPVRAGISETDAYRAATRRGEDVEPDEDGLALRSPDALRLFVHPTPAGRVPALVTTDREDFAALVSALAHQNEPRPVPPSMGALMVSGFNNLDRIAAVRRAWRRENPDAPDEAWRERFRQVAARKELYQDRFVLLTTGGYSGLPAEAMEMDDEAWTRASLVIRLEHECAHYASRRVMGALRKTAWDEIVADYAGIVAAAGRYRAEWALRFLGLERFPGFRAGGRLANYRGSPPVSDAAFAVLRSLAHAAVRALEAVDADEGERAAASPEALAALFGVRLEEAAADDGAERLRRARRDPWRARPDGVKFPELETVPAVR